MKIINSSFEILDNLSYEEILKKIELSGKVCYKSEGNIKEGSAEKFIKGIIKRGHESVVEHFSFSVRFIVDRGISHEIVRHRIASYSQESQRYVNYERRGGGISFIVPSVFKEENEKWNSLDPNYEMTEGFNAWVNALQVSEECYRDMIKHGATPEVARSVLPNATKTEIIMTTNIREWRHFFKLRTAKSSHPDMVDIATRLCDELKKKLPIFFEDIEYNTPTSEVE